MAYSGERAASFAYQGHAGSVKDPVQKAEIAQIEQDEWEHRAHVLSIMQQHGVEVSRWLELRFWVTGKVVSMGCYLIGWFMPYYFAGRLESGNVCEYFVMMRYFHELDIDEHDEILYEMGMKEKEHEEYFLDSITDNRKLALFEKVFGWGKDNSYNDIDSETANIGESSSYCDDYKTRNSKLTKNT